jgi:ABC-2 type transport system permease protein
VNLNFAKKVFGDRWRSTTVYCVAMSLYVLMLAALYPTVSKMSQLKTQAMPKNMLKFFGLQSFDLSTFTNYVVLQLLSFVWIVVMVAFVVAWSRAALAGEMDEGTMEFLLSQPIGRAPVLVTQSLMMLAGMMVLVVVTMLSVIVFGAIFFAHKMTYAGFAVFIPIGIAMFAAVAGYSMFFSAWLSDRKAIMASAGLTLAFYLLHFGGTYSKPISKIDIIGIFHYYNPVVVVTKAHFPVWDFLILLLFAAVFFVAAYLVFRRKDVT